MLTLFDSMRDLDRDITREFDRYFPFSSTLNRLNRSAYSFPLEWSETDSEYTLSAHLPGVNKNEITLKRENGYLSVSAHRRNERNSPGHSEISYGELTRQVRLPKDADASACTARFENGVLTVTLPRSKNSSDDSLVPIN